MTARYKDLIVVTYPSQKPVVLNAEKLRLSKNYGIEVVSALTKTWGQSFVRGLIALDEITEIFRDIKECIIQEEGEE